MKKAKQPWVLDGATLVLPEGLASGPLAIADGKIVGVGRNPLSERQARVWSLSGLYAAPGFIDLQVNGGAGYAFERAGPAEARAAADWCLSCGATGLLATLVTAPLPEMREAVAAVRRAEHPAVLGVHLEGPFIALERKGAHNPQRVLAPSEERLAKLLCGQEDYVRLVTLAPEREGSGPVLRALERLGTVAALGHSDATYAQAMASVGRGVRSFTHLFNAMRGLHHREPGAVGAALDSDAFVELIADGIHVHPAAVRLVAVAKGFDRICLVTDAMSAAGLGDGRYTLGGLQVTVEAGVARLADGTLAGSTLSMNRAVKNFMASTGCSLPQAVRCGSLNPACLLGLDDRKGSLEEGKDADLVVFDEALEVHYTILGGEVVYAREDPGIAPDDGGRKYM